MSAFLRMLGFHLRIFAQNSYFVQLLITSTLSVLLLQMLAGYASHTPDDGRAWLRAGVVGTWSVSTVAAGLISYQRFMGTLTHMVLTPRALGQVMLALVGSAASFGLLAFPLAAAAAWLLGLGVQVESLPRLVLAVLVLWVACLSITSVIAAVFVLTPHAMTYEGLLMVPLILLSGIFGMPAAVSAWVSPVSWLIPTSPAVSALLGSPGPDLFGTALFHGAVFHAGDGFWSAIIASLIGSAAWFAAGAAAMRAAARRALVSGTLEVV